MKFHKTKDGRKIPISDMETSHLENTVKWIERKAKEGVLVRSGGGSTAEDIWYEEDIYTGDRALRHLGYYDYKQELSKRQKTTI